MRRWTLSLAALALAAAPAFAGKFNKVLSVGDKAPAVAGVPAVSADLKDTTLDLAGAKEDVVVVAFLANHCPAVKACEDRLYDLVKSYDGKSVKFIGVCSSGPDMKDQDGIAGIKGAIKDKKYNFTYGYDEDGKIGKSYGATVTPQFFVLDKARTVRYTGLLDAKGGEGKAYVKTAIDAVLANETIEETETRAVGCGIPYKR